MNLLKKLKVNLETGAGREVDTPVQGTDGAYCRKDSDGEITGWEIALAYPAYPLLELYNDVTNASVPLARHVNESDGTCDAVGPFVPHVMHLGNEKKLAVAQIAATRKDVTSHLNPKALDFKRVGNQKLPTYPFSDRDAPDKIVNSVFFVGNSMVTAERWRNPGCPRSHRFQSCSQVRDWMATSTACHGQTWVYPQMM